jgi:leucyl/phenylalanyl-tRNA--protein transferase
MAQFDARDLLSCYARGVFPMADARDDARVFLIDPERRGVIPLNAFHISRRLARTVRGDPFAIRIDTAFRRVVQTCAEVGPGRTETWINHPIEALYVQLHEQGFAHSVECWRGDELVGGLYGVALKGAFFGESMFSRARDASKVALVHLVARLLAGGFQLLDTQFMTEHLAQFGTQEVSRKDYHRRLEAALKVQADFQLGGISGDGWATAVAGAGSGAGNTGAGLGAAGTTGVLGAGRAGAATGVVTAGAIGAAFSGAVALQVISQAS